MTSGIFTKRGPGGRAMHFNAASAAVEHDGRAASQTTVRGVKWRQRPDVARKRQASVWDRSMRTSDSRFASQSGGIRALCKGLIY